MATTPTDQAAGELLRNPDWIRRFIQNYYQSMGVDPYTNMYAQQAITKGQQELPMYYDVVKNSTAPGGAGLDENAIGNYIRQWIDWRRSGQNAQPEWSRTGLQDVVQQQSQDPQSIFRTANQEYNAGLINSYRALANKSLGDRWSGTLGAYDTRQSDQWLGNRLQNQDANGQYSDYLYGRPTPPTPPPGQTSAPAPPPSNQTAPAPPTATAPAPTTGQPAAPVPGAAAPTGGAPGFKSWGDVTAYLMQGHDPRNLMTSGFTAPARSGFSYGGVTYNPAAATIGRTDRNASGRFGGGIDWQGFVYRLQNLQDVRSQGGNADLGITAETTDDELARMAAQWVKQNYTGGSGFTVTQ